MGFGNPMAVRWGRLYEGTEAELALEDAVAALGVPYRTQFPGWKYGTRYFPDFYLPTLRLVLEVDDKSHQHKQLEDEERSADLLDAWGARVVRCTNEEALANPTAAVRQMLTAAGCWPLPESTPKLAACLPKPKRCPKKIKREARDAARQARRKKPRLVRTRSLERN